MSGHLVVRPLGVTDATDLATMLAAQPREYLRYFTPFDSDDATIAAFLSKAIHDVYAGMYWDDRLAAFFMLRGWDDGYDVPAYGVVVDHEFRSRGLARLSIEASKTLCKLRGVRRIMLRVHPDNALAERIYRAVGFRQTGVDARNNLVYHLDL